MISSQQVIERAGITYRQLDYWTRAGYLMEAEEGREGSGYFRFYTEDQAQVAVLLKELVDIGLKPSRASEIIDALRTTGTAFLGANYQLVRSAS